MDAVLGGKMFINGVDVWKEYGVFLVEKKRGDRNNLKAIMAPSKTKNPCGGRYSRREWGKILIRSGREKPGS